MSNRYFWKLQASVSIKMSCSGCWNRASDMYEFSSLKWSRSFHHLERKVKSEIKKKKERNVKMMMHNILTLEFERSVAKISESLLKLYYVPIL